MISHDFRRSNFDSCVYFKQCDDESFLYLLLYIDDMLIAAKDRVEIDRVKVQLGKEFEIKDLGTVKKILGMEISRAGKLLYCILVKGDIMRRFFLGSI